MIRAVLDANIFVSAVIRPTGTPAKIFDAWHSYQFSLVVSEDILHELEHVLQYPRIRSRHRWSKKRIQSFLDDLADVAILTPTTSRLRGIVRDEADHRYLECARDGDAEYIVSGDRDLLSLGEFQGIRILTPREFLDVLARRSKA